MQSWVKGIGPLAQLIAPVREDGTLRPLGVRSLNGKDFAHFWYYGKENLPEVVHLPPNVPSYDSSDSAYDEWLLGGGRSLGHQPAWSWRWALEELIARLSGLLERHEVPIEEGPLAQEYLWQEALAVTRRPDLYTYLIPLAEINDRIREFSDNTSWQGGGLSVHIGKLRKKLENLRRSGKIDIIAPWPGPDKRTGNFLWERYTPEQELARTKAVFAGALESYQQIVSSWFPKFASRMQTAAILPSRMVVIIGRTKDDTPTRRWYFEPLAQEEQSLVDVCFRQEERRESDRDLLKRLESKIRIFRPEMATWLTPSIHHQLVTKLFGLTPATELVYGWLEDDLRGIAWIN